MGTILYHYTDIRWPLLEQLESAAVQERLADKKKDQAFHRGQKGAFEAALQMADIAKRCEPGGPSVGMRPLEEIQAELKQTPAGEPLDQAALNAYCENKFKKEKKNARKKK